MTSTTSKSRLLLIAALVVGLMTGSLMSPAMSKAGASPTCCQSAAVSVCCSMACCQTPAPQNDRSPLPGEKSSTGRDLASFDFSTAEVRTDILTVGLVRSRAFGREVVPASGAPSLVTLHVLLQV